MVAEKAEESLEAIRTGRIDAGDLKRLSPFSGWPLLLCSSVCIMRCCHKRSVNPLCMQMEEAIG